MADRIDLNSANAAELISLPGVGQVLAERIIAYRNTVGRIRRVSELTNIQGLTDAVIRRIADAVSLEPSADEEELPPLVVNIQAQNEASEPYTGHRVVVRLTSREELQDPTGAAPEIVLCLVDIAADLSDDGQAQVTLPDPSKIQGDVRFRFLAPDGEELSVHVVVPDNLNSQMTFQVNPKTFFDIEPNQDPGFGKPSKIRGRVIDATGRVRIANKQVVIWGASVEDPGEADFRALIVAQTGDTGYFSGPYPVGIFTGAFTTIAIGDGVNVPIHLEEDGTFPEMVLLVLPEVPEVEEEAGGEGGGVPRLPDSQDLALAEGTFSNDIVPGQCVDFTKPNRVLEEFSFSYAVRTTEPEIKGLTLEEPDKITIAQIAQLFPSEVFEPVVLSEAPGTPDTEVILRRAPTTRLALSSGAAAEAASSGGGQETPGLPQLLTDRIDAKLFKTLVKDPDAFTATTLAQAASLTAHGDLIRGINKVLKCAPARTRLSCDRPVDWDDEPTIYQACTIAHGHLLRFKQEWVADGYSMGDLLYSLPLAPGQKKQIAVVEWERSETAARTEALIEQEQLAATLSRDRDINEVVNATLSESVRGGSKARTGSFGGGLGIGAILGPVGGLLGIGGGTSSASSSAWQNSSRQTAASSLQQLRDRTSQAASSLRSQRSTVVQTVRQGEQVRAETESVANYNHCHAITIQYFEILRHLLVRQRLVDVQECLFVPLLMTRFNRDKALRWRDALYRAVVSRRLRQGFAAMERIENNYVGSDLPTGAYADEPLEHLDGYLYLRFQLARPRDDDEEAFNSGSWIWMTRLMPWINPEQFYENYLEGQQLKDEIFLEQLGSTIAENFVQLLRVYAVDSNDAETELPIDPTLVADFGNNRPLYVSLRLSGGLPVLARKDIKYIKISYQAPSGEDLSQFLPANSKVIVESGRMSYRTRFSSDYLFRDARIANDLTGSDDARIFTPLNRQELRNPREEDKELARQLLDHLNENLEAYHHAIWWQMSDDRRYMLLDGFEAPNSGGRSVASVVENELIGIVGNCLVLPVARGFHLDPTFRQDLENPIDLLEHYQPNTPIEPVRIALPTKGVYAEAVMGACNSCEHIEEERFWRWEESPIPDSPTAIQPLSTETRRAEPPDLEAKDFPAPIVAMQQAPAAPDPTGLGAALQLLGRSDLFRDITGLTENQRNALAALQGALGTAQFFGGKAADLALQGNMRRDIDRALSKIQEAKSNKLINDEQAAGLTEAALRSMIGGGTEKPADNALTKEPEVKEAIRKASGSPGGEVNVSRTTANTSESVGVKNAPAAQDVGRSFIIENADLTPERRAFNPHSRDKSGTTSFSVRVPRLPAGGSIRWSVPPGAAGRYTLAGGASVQMGNRVDITALRPGLTEIDVEARDAGGTVLESIKLPLSIPQFVTVDVDAATFTPLMTGFNLIDVEIEQVLTAAKDTVDTILSTANVRTVWLMAPFSEALPAQFAAGGAAAGNVTAATLRGDPPSAALYGRTRPGTGGIGPGVFDELIDVFAGAFDDDVSGNANEEVDEVTNEVVRVMVDGGLTSSAEKDLAIQVLGRLLGETLAHEIIHSLIGASLGDGFHNARPGLPDDIMNHGIDRSFQNRSGFELTGPVGSDDLTNLLVDRGIFFIDIPTTDAQAQLNTSFPIPPSFS